MFLVQNGLKPLNLLAFIIFGNMNQQLGIVYFTDC